MSMGSGGDSLGFSRELPGSRGPWYTGSADSGVGRPSRRVSILETVGQRTVTQFSRGTTDTGVGVRV